MAYGRDGTFRACITALGLPYAVGAQSRLTLWPPGEEPLPSKPWSGRGRKPSRLRHDADHRPVSAKELAIRLPAEAWKDVEWREGLYRPLSSRFAAARVRPASRDHNLAAPHPVEWLVVEWPESEAEPTTYWLSTLPEDMPLAVLVDVIKLRWRSERDYDELLESVPGVGPAISSRLLAGLPELGALDRRQIAALAGLAPWTRRSGQWRGKSFIGGGRAHVRSALFMGAHSPSKDGRPFGRPMVAVKHNRTLKAFYERLIAAGKEKMVALIAVARKLLTILNAIVRDGEPWTEPEAHA